jgi:hypothetical protein
MIPSGMKTATSLSCKILWNQAGDVGASASVPSSVGSLALSELQGKIPQFGMTSWDDKIFFLVS